MDIVLLQPFAKVCGRLCVYAIAWSLPILFLPVNTFAQTELFFSEYIEGSSNNKALEVFNGTGSDIDLSTEAYDVQFFFNGNVDAGRTLPLSGILASGDVFVLAHASAAAAILAEADTLASGLWFNGDDAVVLRRGGVIIDAIGQVGFDPGTEWGSGDASTADNTLRRKSAVGSGDTNATDTFEPPVEWDGFAVDTFDGLGSHGGAPPVSPQVTLTVDQSQIPENGGSAQVTANLTQATSVAVTVTLEFTGSAAGQDYSASDNVITIAPAGTGGSISIQTLDDNIEEGNESIVINVLSVTNATEVGEQSVVVEILDDDDAAGIIITQSGGATRATEGGSGDDYTVVLGATPSAEVVITIDPDGQLDVGNGPGQAVVLSFTPENALSPQTVVVSAIDDDLIEGVHSGIITHSASSQDNRYNNLSMPDLSVEIIDNDSENDPETCEITTIELVRLTGCARGNTYEAEIRIIFDNAQSGGPLVVNGQTFSVTSSPALVTLLGLAADGRAVDVTASFSDFPACELTESELFIAPEPCSESGTIDDIIAQVRALMRDSDTPKRALKYLKKAKSELSKARTRLDRGAIDKGFRNMGDAVKQLQRALKRGAETEGAIEAVVTFARGIAEDSVLEAETYANLRGVNRHLNKARSRLLKGDKKRTSGKPDQAIDYYGQAYDHAQRAIRKGRKNQSLSKDNVIASASLPQRFLLAPNYPNPFNPSTTISFSIPTAAEVRLDIFDLQGRLVRNLVTGSMSPGNHQAVWDGLDQAGNAVSSGMYVYRFQASAFRASRKLVLVR